MWTIGRLAWRDELGLTGTHDKAGRRWVTVIAGPVGCAARRALTCRRWTSRPGRLIRSTSGAGREGAALGAVMEGPDAQVEHDARVIAAAANASGLTLPDPADPDVNDLAAAGAATPPSQPAR